MEAGRPAVYLGCFLEKSLDPDLFGEASLTITSAESCLFHCALRGWTYAAIRNRSICTCGDSFNKYGQADSEAACSTKCHPTQSILTDCGGKNHNSLYQVHTISPLSPSPTIQPSLRPGSAAPWFPSPSSRQRMPEDSEKGDKRGRGGFKGVYDLDDSTEPWLDLPPTEGIQGPRAIPLPDGSSNTSSPSTNMTTLISSCVAALAVVVIGLVLFVMYKAKKNKKVPGVDFLIHPHGRSKEEGWDSPVAKSGRSWFPRSRHTNSGSNRGHEAYGRDLELNVVARPDLFAGFESSVLPEDHEAEPKSHGIIYAVSGGLKTMLNPSRETVLTTSTNIGQLYPTIVITTTTATLNHSNPSPISPMATATSTTNANIDIVSTKVPVAHGAPRTQTIPSLLPALMTLPRQAQHISHASISPVSKRQRTEMIQDLILNGDGS